MNNYLIANRAISSQPRRKQKQLDKTHIIYLLCTAFYFIRMFYLNIPIGVICGVIILFFSIGSVLNAVKSFSKRRSSISYIVYLFVFWNLFSIVHYAYNGIPVSVFFSDALSSLIPVLFYFQAQESTKEKTYKWYCVITSIITIIGIYLYISLPSFYLDFLEYSTYSGRFYADIYERSGRLCSIYNSTIIGMLCCYAVAISMHELLFNNRRFYFIHLLINLLGVILSYQRSTIVVTFLIIALYFIIFFFSKKPKSQKKIIVFFSLFIIAGLVVTVIPSLEFSNSSINFSRYIDQFLTRMSSLDGMVSERSEQWISALQFPKSLLFGSGLGSVGHHAVPYHLMTVRDGNFIKIICEIGIIGFLLFVALFSISIIKGLKKGLFCEVAIIMIGLLHCVGSNGLSLLVPSFLFWYAIGIIDYKNSEVIK